MRIKWIYIMLNFIILIFCSGKEVQAKEIPNHDFAIELSWISEDTDEFHLYEEDDTLNLVGIRVSYSSSGNGQSVYQPGDIVITLDGIGNVNRFYPIQAFVGADNASSERKQREWSYTWNKVNDTYTMTNNYAINGDSVVSGYFELVWEIDSRSSVHGYSQKEIEASLLLPDGTTVRSNCLSFSNETMPDDFSINMEENWLYSSEGLTFCVENPEDYIYIKYNLDVIEHKNSRGLKNEAYRFCVDNDTSGKEIILIDPENTATLISDGIYELKVEKRDNLSERWIYVLYPKTNYLSSNIQPSFSIYGRYYEDEGNSTELAELAKKVLDIKIPSEFTFMDYPGVGYEFWMDTYYDKYIKDSIALEKNGDIPGSSLINGTTEIFYLEGSVFVPDGDMRDLEIVDDYIYVLQNDGNYYKLSSNEYSYDKVIVPGTDTLKNTNGVSIAADIYSVKIYAYQSDQAVTENSGVLIYEDKLKKSSIPIDLPEKTTSIRICIEGLEESITEYSFPVYLKFQISDKAINEINIKNGKVVNTSFIRLYDRDKKIINNYFTSDDYIMNDTNINLAHIDMAVYGEYLDREKDEITIYEMEKCEFGGITEISQIQIENEKSYADISIGAEFVFPKEINPDAFSMYCILPPNIKLQDVKEDYQFWNTVSAEGFLLTEDELFQCLQVEIIDDYKGSDRQYVALHFNGIGRSLPNIGKIRIKFPVVIQNDLFNQVKGIVGIRSCVIMDKEIPIYTAEKEQDTGTWSDDENLGADIDMDSDTTEYLAYDYDYSSYRYASSSELHITKDVITEYENEIVSFGSNYIYCLKLKNGYNKSKNIVITDEIEASEKNEWQGSLQRIEIKGPDLSESDYQIYTEEKKIKIDFQNYVLKEGEELTVLLYMKSPNEVLYQNKVIENSFTAQLMLEDLVTGSVSEHEMSSNKTQLKLSYPLRSVIIKAEDAETDVGLSGAQFVLINKDTGETIIEAVSNVKGYAVMTDIPSNAVYEIKEVIAPKGYLAADVVTVSIQDEDVNVNIHHTRRNGTIQIINRNALNQDIKIEGASYGLYNSEGKLIREAITNEDGVAAFTDLSWQNYKIQQLEVPLGYVMDENEYVSVINTHTVEDIQVFQSVSQQSYTHIKVLTKEKCVDDSPTDIPVSGCVFELYYKKQDMWISYGSYVTDEHGFLQITDNLPYGTYLLKEKRCPLGYIRSDSVEFELSPESPEVSLVFYNKRKAGDILIVNKDNLGNCIMNSSYDLYDAAKETIVKSGITDTYGNVEWSDLEWGTYYLIQKSTSECYVLDLEWKEIRIGADGFQHIITCINETKKGRVQLISTDESGQSKLAGAVYDLYTIDGILMKENLVTDENGGILVSDLEWGSYYFQEVKAPTGYVIQDEKIRFSVNALNAGYTQNVMASNAIDKKVITITKTIKAEDINDAHGSVSFLFCLKGQDMASNAHYYYRMVSFNESDIALYERSDGYISKNITFSGIPAGTYYLEEEESSRYYLKSIINLENSSYEDGMMMIDLNTNETASAEFISEKYENQGLSDAVSISNILKTAVKLTGIDVEWTGQVYSGVTIDRDALCVKAFYDDGTMRYLDNNEYTLERETFPVEDGKYTISVSYSERGIFQTDSFNAEVTDGVRIPKRIEVQSISGQDYYIGTQLNEEMFEVTAIYSDGSEEILSVDILPELVEDPEAAVTISSPNWPENYPDNMSLEENTWSQNFEGADAVKVVFSSGCELEADRYDYILIKDDTQIPITKKLGLTHMSRKTYISYGDFVEVSMCSDSNGNHAGFQAQLIPCYYEYEEESDYTISARRVPSETGNFDLEVVMKIPGLAEELCPKNTITLNAVERPCATFEIGAPNKDDVIADLYQDGTLHISGMGDTDIVVLESSAPWYSYKNEISTVIIDQNVAPTNMDYWFVNSNTLLSVNQIPDSVVSMKGTFKNCKSMTAVSDLPSGLTNMYQTFYGCYALEELPEIPSGVTTLKEAFVNCRKIQVPPAVSELAISDLSGLSGTFRGCYELQYAPELPESYTGSLDRTFENCYLIEAAPDIPDGVTSMSQTFKECENLTNVPVIPETVTSMKETFYNCSKIIEASAVPASVMDLSKTFYGCTNLLQMPKVNSTADLYYTFAKCSALTSVDIPEGVLSIEGAFSYCSKITEMPVIHTGIENMNSAFYYCKMMKNAKDIPASVKKMDKTFGFCVRLNGTMVFDAEPEIYTYCFYNCARSSYSEGLILTGDCSVLEEIAATKSSDSLIEVS